MLVSERGYMTEEKKRVRPPVAAHFLLVIVVIGVVVDMVRLLPVAVVAATAAAAADPVDRPPFSRPFSPGRTHVDRGRRGRGGVRRPVVRGNTAAVRRMLERLMPTTESADRFHVRILMPPLGRTRGDDSDDTGDDSDDDKDDSDDSDDRDDVDYGGECAPGVGPPCFVVSDAVDGDGRAIISVAGTTASEVAAGIGHYLRTYCNMTIGWPRGGGSDVSLPRSRDASRNQPHAHNRVRHHWIPPPVGPDPLAKRRIVPYSYLLNVCAHSYSLLWYTPSNWLAFIDWLALTGINLIPALTGQEEVQYKVFRALGLSDADVRNWFNGPALLTWSRGQNEYGSGMLGTLPRTWMRRQWRMQRQLILPTLRGLGIMGQLPGFQGNVPVALRHILNDDNITVAGGTGWMDSLDPMFATVADLWMETLLADFGTDHWYQMDGYFNGGTAPWMFRDRKLKKEKEGTSASPTEPTTTTTTTTHLSSSTTTQVGIPTTTTTSTITTAAVVTPPPRDDAAYRRASNAYMGLNRTDPNAIWSFQGWAVEGWSTMQDASTMRGFVDAPPSGHFVIVDMSTDGYGQHRTFVNSSNFFGAPFVWTALHNFGGTDGIKGNLSLANRIPFDALASAATPTTTNTTTTTTTTASFFAPNPIGTGATPEGIDQNTAYYEFLFEANFRTEPVPNITSHMIQRAHRRYRLLEHNADVAEAWALLVDGNDALYGLDLGVQDGFGVAHLPAKAGWGRQDDAWWPFEEDRATPTRTLCRTVRAWQCLINAATKAGVGVARGKTKTKERDADPDGAFQSEPFRYDLVNLGRQVLASLSNPKSLNFADALEKTTLNRTELIQAGCAYVDLLLDLDVLVGTDDAFLLGPWLEKARSWGKGQNDCVAPELHRNDRNKRDHRDYHAAADTATAATTMKIGCEDYMEWNARCQLTSWRATKKTDTKIPPGPVDYAGKHWNGLVRDYYAVRAKLALRSALDDEEAGRRLNKTALNRVYAEHAYNWTTTTTTTMGNNGGGGSYATSPVGDALEVSRLMMDKYRHWFDSCWENREEEEEEENVSSHVVAADGAAVA